MSERLGIVVAGSLEKGLEHLNDGLLEIPDSRRREVASDFRRRIKLYRARFKCR